MQKLGVPYMGVNEETVTASLAAQGGIIARSLASMNIQTEPDREIIAVIAYLQRLGLDGKAALERASNAAAAGPADDPHTGLNTKATVNPHGGANDPAASAPVNPHGPSGAQDVKPANPHGGNR
jgi:hypothetical protein